MIKIYDDLVTPSYRECIYDFVQASFFKIGNQDGSLIETSSHRYLHSPYSKEDLINSKFVEAVQGTEVGDLLNTHEITSVRVNLSVPSDSNFLHTHHESIVILYYVNLKWDADWAGETVFYSDNMDEIIKAVNIKPGRIVVFDGSLFHSVRPQAPVAPHYRFTLAITLQKNT
jgi:SM-20-related protein